MIGSENEKCIKQKQQQQQQQALAEL